MTSPTSRIVWVEPALAGLLSKLRALYELGKPNLSLLVVVTAVTGFFLASRSAGAEMGLLKVFMLIAGTGLTAMGACAANMCREAEVDERMHRTRGRPITSGRVSEEEAFGFALGTFLVGFSFLYVFCGPLPAFLSLVTIAVYVFVYTPSKLKGPISIWIGALPGAIPPVMGWSTVTGSLGVGALALFLLLFTWQFPHFLALAYMYRADYARGGFRFLPETDTERRTGRAIALGSVAVVASSLLPFIVGLAGPVYLVLVLAAGWMLLRSGFRALLGLTSKTARSAFLSSIIYLPVFLVALVLDRLLL